MDADTIWWLGMIDSPLTIIQVRISRSAYEATQRELEARRRAA